LFYPLLSFFLSSSIFFGSLLKYPEHTLFHRRSILIRDRTGPSYTESKKHSAEQSCLNRRISWARRSGTVGPYSKRLHCVVQEVLRVSPRSRKYENIHCLVLIVFIFQKRMASCSLLDRCLTPDQDKHSYRSLTVSLLDQCSAQLFLCRHSGYYTYHLLEHLKLQHCAHTVLTGLVWISELTTIIDLQSLNQLVINVQCVFCETELAFLIIYADTFLTSVYDYVGYTSLNSRIHIKSELGRNRSSPAMPVICRQTAWSDEKRREDQAVATPKQTPNLLAGN
jgi:hypothetical protein